MVLFCEGKILFSGICVYCVEMFSLARRLCEYIKSGTMAIICRVKSIYPYMIAAKCFCFLGV